MDESSSNDITSISNNNASDINKMNYKDWSNNINKINIWNDLKDKILSFFSSSDQLYFYKLTNQKLKDAFINIKSYKNIYTVFDIEFQTVITDKNLLTEDNPKGDKVASFPREIGIMIFVRDKNDEVFYIGSIYRNFRYILDHGFIKDNLKYMLETYTTVSDQTSKKMLENDKIFRMENKFDA